MRDGAAHITVQGHAELEGRDVVVPADPSSAAFIIAAALYSAGVRGDGRGRASQSNPDRALCHAQGDGRRCHLHERARSRWVSLLPTFVPGIQTSPAFEFQPKRPLLA